ncbi:MAG: sugar ABC transporter permease [Anaerolineae bacterium]|nr:sugar ABC transporter permease [Anaerolineae bacterium]
MANSVTARGPSRREAFTAYALISPWLVGFVVFTAGPMIVSLALSFTEYNVVSPVVWRGTSNYTNAFFGDPLFWQSIKVTFVYAALSLIPGLVVGLAVALLLNLSIPWLSVWRAIYYLPSVISGVAVAVLWQYVLNPRFGIVNWALSLVGIKGPGWLADPNWALPSLALMSLWAAGGAMVLYLAALQGVPTALYDAAKVDGANAYHRLRFVTLPMISPVIFFNLVMGTIATFQYFTNAYVMTGGGPNNATLFYNLHLYNHAFRYFRMGYAAALAWVLFVIILLLTLVIFRSSTAWVYYEGQLKAGRS